MLWARACHLVLSTEVKHSMFLVMHNIIQIREQLFRFRMVNDHWCEKEVIMIPILGPLREDAHQRSEMVFPFGGEVHNLEHLFCDCVKVRECWSWIRTIILRFIPVKVQ